MPSLQPCTVFVSAKVHSSTRISCLPCRHVEGTVFMLLYPSLVCKSCTMFGMQGGQYGFGAFFSVSPLQFAFANRFCTTLTFTRQQQRRSSNRGHMMTKKLKERHVGGSRRRMFAEKRPRRNAKQHYRRLGTSSSSAREGRRGMGGVHGCGIRSGLGPMMSGWKMMTRSTSGRR